MTRALVLMKALPPTKGHERLIRFAQGFAEKGLVLMDTAPGEPLVNERRWWLHNIADNNTGWYSWVLEVDDQDPESDGFWKRWKDRIHEFCLLEPFDVVIGSEPYCAKVAEVIGARYIPYDPKRELESARGTDVRNYTQSFFFDVATGFQPYLRTTLTVFGGESTGKTTLSKRLADEWSNGEWVFEWARPYLEATGQTVCDLAAMHEIWHGQFAAERNAERFAIDKPFVVRDTDLYSTIGYWEQPHWIDKYGPVPDGLIQDARYHKADLYLITQSNIPFEKDPLRYGGDHRESPDEYWISVAEKYDLPYEVLTASDIKGRLLEAGARASHAFKVKNKSLMRFERVGQ